MGAIRLPGMLVTFLQERASVACAATRDARRRPHTHWVSAWRVRDDGKAVLFSIPAEFADTLLANVAENGRLAVTAEHIGPHETYQFKGRVIASGPADDADRDAAARLRERFARDVQKLEGREHPGDALQRYCMTPAVTVTLEIEEVYQQTPGPSAGRRLVPPEATL